MTNILVTSDIDGTIVIGKNKGLTHKLSFQHALKEAFDVDQEISTYPGTDYGISRSIITRAIGTKDIPPNLMKKFIDKTEEYYLDNFDGEMEILPGVDNAFSTLSKIPNVTLGLCTGNFPRIGWEKVKLANLIQYFPERVAGFGTVEKRSEILAIAIKDAEVKTGHSFDRIIHIGDSPEDVQAALDNNAIPVLVQTSPHEFDSFPTPHYTIKNLKDDFDEFLSIVMTGHPKNSDEDVFKF